MATKQDMQLFTKNLYIYSNYETVVKKYNSGCRNYIRTPKREYEERVIHLFNKLFEGENEKDKVLSLLSILFDGKTEEEILQAFQGLCNEP